MKTQNMILTLVLLLLCACAKTGSDSVASLQWSDDATTPQIFSKWVSDDLSTTIDLRNSGFNQVLPVQFSLASGEVCETDTMIAGKNLSAGTAVVSNSHYTGGGSGDPGCALLNHNYIMSYSPSGPEMVICPIPSGACTHFNRQP